MEKIFDKNTLMQTSIHELRDIARTIGVYSPTTCKKEELSDKIFKIVNGEEKPHIAKSRQGRPPKNLSGKTKMLETFLPSMNERAFDLDCGSSIGILSEGIIAFLEDSKNPVLSSELFTGYLDVIDEVGYGIIRPLKNTFKEGKTVYVSSGQIENFNLKCGDLLTVEARLLHKEKPLVLTIVKKINNRDYKNAIRNEDFENLQVEFPIRELRFETEPCEFDTIKDTKLLPLVCGTRNLILVEKQSKFNIATLLRGLNLLVGGKTVYLGLDVLPELVPFMQNITKCETMFCTLGEEAEKQSRIIQLSLKRVKRLVEEKNDVLLIVDSLDKIAKNQNSVYENNISDINNKTLKTLKSILGASRSISMGGSLTEVVVMYYREDSYFDKSILLEVEDLFNNVIRLN